LSFVELPDERAIGELASRFGGAVDAAVRERRVTRVTSPADASRPDELVLVSSRRAIEQASSAPGVLLCDQELVSRLPEGRRWAHTHPLWVVSRLLEPLAERQTAVAWGSPQVAPDADVHPSARIGAGAVVLSGARIGPDTQIGPNAVVYGGVTIGARVVIGPLAVIGRPGFGFTQGPGGETVRVPQLGGVVIEDDVEIGALASVDAGTLGPTRVHEGSKLDAHVHVGHNSEIGPGCLVAAQSGFAGSVRVGSGVRVGGQSGVTDHARIGDDVTLLAKSGVVGDVPAGAVVAGFPAVPRMRWLRGVAVTLARASRTGKR
jgi:UDP-3-O-[3-hydroxymyristoyl] glucosamine N-acyltransferase